MPRVVACPSCSKAVPWTEASRWRPFCSQRCKLVDLGEWAAERHVVAGSAPVDAPVESAPDPAARASSRQR